MRTSCVTTKKRTVKARGNAGFSLPEMLLCVLILALSGGVITATLNLGIEQFQARTRESERRLLCDTLSLVVQEYLTYANVIETDGASLKRFKTGAVGALYGDKQNGKWYQFKDDAGQIAIGAEENTHYLVDKSQYVTTNMGGEPGTALKAALEVTVNQAERYFVVKISVSEQTDDTRRTENEFIVIPVNPRIFTETESS